jgi:hypothetical protein
MCGVVPSPPDPKFRDRVRRHRGVNDQHQRRNAGHGHAGEISGRIDGELAIQRGRDRERGLCAHHQRVSIGRRFRHCFGGDHAAGAGTILHHHRLTQSLAQLLRQNARGDVGAAAGGEAHDDLDWPVRIRCGLRLARERGQAGGEREPEQNAQRCPQPSPLDREPQY